MGVLALFDAKRRTYRDPSRTLTSGSAIQGTALAVLDECAASRGSEQGRCGLWPVDSAVSLHSLLISCRALEDPMLFDKLPMCTDCGTQDDVIDFQQHQHVETKLQSCLN